MKLNNVLVGEGLIKLPKEMLATLLKEVRTAGVSYMRARLIAAIQASEASRDVKKQALKFFDDYYKRVFPDITFRKINLDDDKLYVKHLGWSHRDEYPEAYQKLLNIPLSYEFHFDPSAPLKLRFKFDYKELQNRARTAAGLYHSNHNTIDLDFKKLKFINWAFVVEQVAAFVDGNEPKAKMVERLLARTRDELMSIEGTTEHELTHYVQYHVLGRGHMDQLDGDIAGKAAKKRPTAGYSTEQAEFDPLIKSALSETRKWINIIERAEGKKVDWKTFGQYMVGSIDHQTMMRRSGIKPSTSTPGAPLKFFMDLKSHDRAKWQKGVKYFMLELEERLKES